MGIIILAEDHTCMCNCGTRCVSGKRGMASRCTKEQIETAGFTTMTVPELFEKRSWLMPKKKSFFEKLLNKK